MDRPRHRLSISSAEPGAVFRVTDGSSARVGTGMYRMELELPRGLYTVSAMLGCSIEAKEVILDGDQKVEFGHSLPSFGELAFALAPKVCAVLPAGSLEGPGTAVIAICGPFRSTPGTDTGIELDVDGTALAPTATGTLSDAAGAAWSWRSFRIGQDAPGAPGVVTATRPVERTRTSHVVPRMGDHVVWAVYPAPRALAPEGVELPPAHYVRLRLTPPGEVPDPDLQSLSDQVFTALAARATLPLSEPVLDLLLAERSDPLLALASAHVASLTLAQDGLLPPLPQDAVPAGAAGKDKAGVALPGPHDRPIAPEVLRQRFVSWLEEGGGTSVESCPDLVAVRALFGVETRADIRKPPVLLRSLDALVEATHPDRSRGATQLTLDESVWRSRFQVSESFAFLQWEPGQNSQDLLLAQVKQSFELAQTLEEARRTLAPEPAAAARAPMGFGARAPDPMESFMRQRAAGFRIPASAVREMASELAKSRARKP
jgi:hypothetical protein